MSWLAVEVGINGTGWKGMMNPSNTGAVFAVPYASGVEVGGTIESGGKTYTVKKVTDVAHRGETFLVETEGNTNGKSKARRTRDNAGEEDANSEGDA